MLFREVLHNEVERFFLPSLTCNFVGLPIDPCKVYTWLVQNGVDVNQSKDGRNALWYCTEVEEARVLVDLGMCKDIVVNGSPIDAIAYLRLRSRPL
jgi:hypothetical protein